MGWRSYQHQLSMIADITAVFRLGVEADALYTLASAVNGIGMTKYRVAVRLLMLLKPGQMAVFNGVLFLEVAKLRIRALGTAYIELCKSVKLGTLKASEMTSDKGIRILKDEFKRQLRKPRPD
jgi:hypothetical protein